MHTISPELIAKLEQLLEVFLEENTQINLSALRTKEACWTGNILDSLACLELPFVPELNHADAALLDIGTGGGFPLLPLAITLPKMQCTGMDATKKKIDAIARIVEHLQLSNVTLQTGRAESLGHSETLREQFDLVTARAVAPIATLLEFCAPFAKKGGHVVLWKSMHIAEELEQSSEAQRLLHCTVSTTHAYDLGGDWGTRQLLVFEKTEQTPNLYPRADGMPKKNPLE